MKTFKLFSMAALALAMAACSNEDSALENAAPAQQQGAMKFTATLAAPGSATTRTVYTEVTESTDPDYNKIKVAWKAGDQIYLYDENNSATCTANVGTPAGDGSATISGTFSQEVAAGHRITATYPVSAVNNDFNAKFASQAGTPAYIQDNLDYRIGNSTISVEGTDATLATALEMESQIAIWKLTLQDNAATPAALSATKVTIKNGSTVIAATTDITATSAVYLALNLKEGNISGADITIEATVGSDTYTYSKSGVSLAKGNYYQSTVTMAKASVPVTAITLNKTATTITAGQTETLSVSSVTPDDATDQTVTWSSDNEAVATVDADGKVTAVALGTANITATANDGSGVTATCAVTVSKVVTINQSDWGDGYSPSFTKDGVTVSAGMIDSRRGNLMDDGSFSTTLGNFTKIVVTTTRCYASGTGWSGGGSSMTWEGTPASTVSFSGEFLGNGTTQTTIVCTIVPAN